MAKSLVLGNGKLTVGLDSYGQVYDLYFPYVGLENHTGGAFVHKIGVWVDGEFAWLDNGEWAIDFISANTTHTDFKMIAINEKLQVRLEFCDEVYNEKNIFLREVKVINLSITKKEVRLFFNQQFEIYESYRGDTSYYDPNRNIILHYKGRRVFLINAYNFHTQKYFDQYGVGLFGIEGREGTYKDAEDGTLEGNAIEHGLTDSVIGLTINLEANAENTIYYWMCVAKLMDEAQELNDYVLKRTPDYLIRSTKKYWEAWIGRNTNDFHDLEQDLVSLYYNSLKVMRVHTDNSGGIIASADSDLLKHGRDAYSYVWPRDAAMTSIAFSRAGYNDLNEEIFTFFNNAVTKEGYLMHKYRSDGSLGSSWHPWIYKGIKELPIQIDETALVAIALWEEFQVSKDIEFIEKIYNSLVRKIMEFLISRIDIQTGMMKPSYDLWEEKFGTSTFGSAAVYGALKAGAEFAGIFGKYAKSREYAAYAEMVREGILKHHYDKNSKSFYKLILPEQYSVDKKTKWDSTVDSSSLYGLFKYGVLPVDDPRMQDMFTLVKEKLEWKEGKGGVARYEGDDYFRTHENPTGNPWIITTLWLAQMEIEMSKTIMDLKKTKKYLDWVYQNTSHTDILSEQIDPYSGEGLSATPLTWSHAEYVITVLDYIRKFHSFT